MDDKTSTPINAPHLYRTRLLET